jgi:hypothetical protein
LAQALLDGVREILARLLPKRRRRNNPRVVKRKMSNFPLKRTRHHNQPQPPREPAEAIRIAPHYRAVSANKQRQPL